MPTAIALKIHLQLLSFAYVVMPLVNFGTLVNSLPIFNGKVAVSVFGVFLVSIDMGCVLQHSVTTLWSLDNFSFLVLENRTDMDVGIP